MADGFEEIEALAPLDVLRRAGADVRLLSVSKSTHVTGARGVCVVCDSIADGGEIADMIVLPGGFPGYKNLAESAIVQEAVKAQLERRGFVGAICGAPAAVLGAKGLLCGKRAVCYPGMESELDCGEIPDCGVCTDGNIITAKSAGYALDFALELTKNLLGNDAADTVRRAIVYNG